MAPPPTPLLFSILLFTNPHLQDLVTRGEGWVRDVVLMIGSSDVTMKEDSTQVMIILTGV